MTSSNYRILINESIIVGNLSRYRIEYYRQILSTNTVDNYHRQWFVNIYIFTIF